MQLWHVIEGKKANLIATGKYFASCDKGVTGMTLSKTRVDNRPLRSTRSRLELSSRCRYRCRMQPSAALTVIGLESFPTLVMYQH